jgi:undecaprenyl-diphosphatase
VKRAVKEVIAGDPGRAARRWLGWLSIAALVLFIGDTYLVTSGALLKGFDVPAARAVQAFPWGPIGSLMTLTNDSGGWGQVILGAVAVVGLFFYERRAGWLVALGAIGSVIDSLVKTSIARHRPTADLVAVLHASAGYSYPSGHAVFFTWLAFMLAVVFAPRVRPSRRVAIWLAAVALILIACVGRVWAGAHWPSDVIGGFLLALSWSAFVLSLPERWLPAPSWHWFSRLGRARKTA